MAIDDRSRHELFQRLDEVLGPEAAEVLMSHLPPVGWADVATKRDIDALEARLNLRFEQVDARFEVVAERIEKVEERLAGRLMGEIGGVRQDMAESTGSIRQEIGALQAEFANQTRQIMFAMIGLIFTAVLLTYTAARFG